MNYQLQNYQKLKMQITSFEQLQNINQIFNKVQFPWQMHISILINKNESKDIIQQLNSLNENNCKEIIEKKPKIQEQPMFDDLENDTLNFHIKQQSSTNIFQPSFKLSEQNVKIDQKIKQDSDNNILPKNINDRDDDEEKELDSANQIQAIEEKENNYGSQDEDEQDEIFNEFIGNVTSLLPINNKKIAKQNQKRNDSGIQLIEGEELQNQIMFDDDLGDTIITNKKLIDQNKNKFQKEQKIKINSKDLDIEKVIKFEEEVNFEMNKTILPNIQLKEKKIKFKNEIILNDLTSEKIYFIFAKQFELVKNVKNQFKVEMQVEYDKGRRFEVSIIGKNKEEAAQQLREMAKQIHYQRIENDKAKFFRHNSFINDLFNKFKCSLLYIKYYGIGYVLFGGNKENVINLGQKLNSEIYLEKIFFIPKAQQDFNNMMINVEAYLKHLYVKNFELPLREKTKQKCIYHMEVDEGVISQKEFQLAGLKITALNKFSLNKYFKPDFIKFFYQIKIPLNLEQILNQIQQKLNEIRLVIVSTKGQKNVKIDFAGKRPDFLKFFNSPFSQDVFSKCDGQACITISKKYFLNSDKDIFKDFADRIEDKSNDDIYEIWITKNHSKFLHKLIYQITSVLNY